MLPNLPEIMSRRLERPLPGRRAMRPYEPELSYGRHSDPPRPGARQAAVIALLYPHSGEWHLPLILRPVHMSEHAGQVSFPGGMSEPGETSAAAGLRELSEELGIEVENARILGRLSLLHLYSTNFAITPWIAWLPARPEMRPNPTEVAAVLEVPLAHLCDEANIGRHLLQRGGLRFFAPHISWHGHQIWGATALILGELLAVVAEAEAGG